MSHAPAYRRRMLAAALSLAVAGVASAQQAPQAPTVLPGSRPNIVFILADDLGFGSVGFNGGTMIHTPTLDRLAAEGLVFNRAYAATVCAPTRAMLLTGFHNGHTATDRNQNIGVGLRPQDVSVADVLKLAGYNTAVFGKWGFGGNSGDRNADTELRPNPAVTRPEALPQHHGFDHFFGYISHGHAHSYQVETLFTLDPTAEHGVTLAPTGNTPDNRYAAWSHDVIHERSLDFLRDAAQQDAPFFCYLAYTVPHFDIDSIGRFDDLMAPYTGPDYRNWPEKARTYAAMVTRMDATIAEVLNTLNDPNGDGDTSDSVAHNTLVLFSSDNGPTPEDGSPIDFLQASAPLTGGKRHLTEGGIRVPQLAYWPGVIQPGQRIDTLTDLADFMPTAAELAGVLPPPGVDGVSLVPTLQGYDQPTPRAYIPSEFHEGNGPNTPRWTIIGRRFKLITLASGEQRLYDLENDLAEQHPLDLSNPQFAEIADLIRAAADEARVAAPDPYAVTYTAWPQSSDAAPNDTWSVVLAGHDVTLDRPAEVLGLQLGGDAPATLTLPNTASLHAINELRVVVQGTLDLQGGGITSRRPAVVYPGGAITGAGRIPSLINHGSLTVQPLDPDRLTPQTPAPSAAEPFTGDLPQGRARVATFDIQGQDQSPQRGQLHPAVTAGPGLAFDRGVTPRAAVNAGNEFNLQGFTTNTLAAALQANDTVSLTLQPAPGVAFDTLTVTFTLWRNGPAAATDYAIVTSADNFRAPAARVRTERAGSNTAETLTATVRVPNTQATEPVAARLVGWNGTGNGNTHITGATVDATLRAVEPRDAAPDNTTPGDPPAARLAVAGDLVQSTAGSLTVPAAADLPAVHVAGRATLAGTLIVTPAGNDNLPPRPFVLLQADAITGTFETIDLSALPNPDALTVRYTDDAVLLVDR